MNVAWTKIVLTSSRQNHEQNSYGGEKCYSVFCSGTEPPTLSLITQVVVSMTAAMNSSVHTQATHYY